MKPTPTRLSAKLARLYSSRDDRSHELRILLTARIAIAAAPVSFGAFEVTVGTDPNVPDAAYVLDAVEREGYEGIDLGPPGFLGTADDLGIQLRSRGLHLAGGFMSMPFSDPAGMPTATAELRALLDLLDT